MITGNSPARISSVKQELRTKYEMKDLGRIQKYLGVQFKFFEEGILLHQEDYFNKLLQEHGMTDCKPSFTPLPEGMALLNETGTPDEDPVEYGHLVGELIFLTQTRPDITHAVGVVSRFMSKPQQSHLQAAKHILRYCKSTPDYGIAFYQNQATDGATALTGFTNSWKMHGYTDSDWAADKQTRRSIGGQILTFAGGPVSWASKRQPTVSLSSTEAEYKSLSDGAREAVHLSRLLQELNIVPTKQTPLRSADSELIQQLANSHIPGPDDMVLHCDNSGAIKLSRNPVFHARSKHIELYHHFIRERVLEGKIKVEYLSTEDQPADLLTKALGRIKFEKHRNSTGMRPANSI
ncbi:unnamed protein product [Calypogeia fissa]